MRSPSCVETLEIDYSERGGTPERELRQPRSETPKTYSPSVGFKMLVHRTRLSPKYKEIDYNGVVT